MNRILLCSLLLLGACDLRPSDNPPNEAIALLMHPRTGQKEYCKADFWSRDTARIDACIRRFEAKGYALVQKNY